MRGRPLPPAIAADLPKTRASVRLKKKSESAVMRALGALLGFITPAFMERFWTTSGHTIYIPTRYDTDPRWGTEAWCREHMDTLGHEVTHVVQVERWGLIVQGLIYVGPAPFLAAFSVGLGFLPVSAPWIAFAALTVLSLPLSFGLAWGRWRIEREAYLVNIRAVPKRGFPPDIERDAEIARIADTLWKNYALTWPRAWARAWFKRNA